jgi:hypothetical protein
MRNKIHRHDQIQKSANDNPFRQSGAPRDFPDISQA